MPHDRCHSPRGGPFARTPRVDRRLDAILVYTLAERFKRTQAVGRLKAAHDLPPSDPAREATQMARLDALAKEADLDPDLAKKFLTFIISEVIRHHEKLQK